MLDEGCWADVQINGEHLRLFSERTAQGAQVSVYDVNSKRWLVPSEPADDIEDGKVRAEIYAKVFLKEFAKLELPPLIWKDARAV
jgi:hypothetical protein